MRSRQRRIFGFTMDQALRGLFGGNALVSIVVLGLITFFLFKEGSGFFGMYRESISLYRKSGVEYTDIMREQSYAFSELNRYLDSIRSSHVQKLQAEGVEFAEVKRRLSAYEDFIYDFERLGDPLREYVIESGDVAIAARDLHEEHRYLAEYRDSLLMLGRDEEAAQVEILEIDLTLAVDQIRESAGEFLELSEKLARGVRASLESVPSTGFEEPDQKFARFAELAELYLAEMPDYAARLASWDPDRPVGMLKAFLSFLFGDDWITNSSIQDWYGIAPLFLGSMLVALIAMLFAIPLGVGAAIYVNQVATRREQGLIKPYIEFISAIPSVVIGFFGIAVFGEFLREASGWPAFSAFDAFPISERLTAFTAGCLLALMAIPTIFTLAEDAMNNVPKSFKEASLAMGATRLQTTIRIIVPTSLSGIVSAVLLGFGRVIGETMVVLLCAGNRIEVPNFTNGLGGFFEPVHTMTGIIAQELGEVVNGSIHYRALFMVGMVLFVSSLMINYIAQKIVLRYRMSIG